MSSSSPFVSFAVAGITGLLVSACLTDPEEARYPAVQYVPRNDANMALLERTERTTHCPYKGDANYFSIKANGTTVENSIWTYENPFPAMAEIAGHLAFYPDKVKIEEVA